MVATGLTVTQPHKCFGTPSEGLRDHFSESLTAAEGAGSFAPLFSLAASCARIEAGSAELCHTLQRGHQQWELILTPITYTETQTNMGTKTGGHMHNIQETEGTVKVNAEPIY